MGLDRLLTGKFATRLSRTCLTFFFFAQNTASVKVSLLLMKWALCYMTLLSIALVMS